MAISRLRAETDPAAPYTVLTNSLATGCMSFQLRCHTAGARALAAPRGRLHELDMHGLEQLVARNNFLPPVLDGRPARRTRGNQPFRQAFHCFD